jgi:hypothetical protein
VSMVTNDKILTERHIEFLIDYGLDEVMISVHGTLYKDFPEIVLMHRPQRMF